MFNSENQPCLRCCDLEKKLNDVSKEKEAIQNQISQLESKYKEDRKERNIEISNLSSTPRKLMPEESEPKMALKLHTGTEKVHHLKADNNKLRDEIQELKKALNNSELKCDSLQHDLKKYRNERGKYMFICHV